MADKPLYVTEQDNRTIQQRMLEGMPSRYDKAEGGFAWDATAPAAVEFAKAGVQAQRVLEVGFYPTGAWLDLRLAEAGLERKVATKAVGAVTFTGTAGLVILAGRQVSTASLASKAAALFVTDATLTLDGTGHGTVGITAVTAGAAGNVAAATVQFMGEPLPGITALTNGQPTTGGTEREDDPAGWARFLERRRNPSAGGNASDYKLWALSVAGVGGASVVPVRDGPGTVSVAIIGTDKLPAAASVVAAVQDYIAPPWLITAQAEAMTLSGFGASVDNTRSDDTGDSVKMLYNVSGYGRVAHLLTGAAVLPKPGIWQAKPRVLVNSAAAVANLLQVGVWNVTAAAWCKTRPAGAVDAVRTLQAADLSAAAFTEAAQEFYWNGADQVELRVDRLTTDTTTTVWVDDVVYRSTFSKDTGAGRAPIGARLTVEAAVAVNVTVSATLVIQAGYDPASVKSAVQTAMAAYIKGLAFAVDNDVRFGRVGQTMLDVPGVQDYSNLLVNGASTNVVVGDQAVAVLGTVTLT